jgi:hypothetical protein
MKLNPEYALGRRSKLCSMVWVMFGVLRLLVGSVTSLIHVWCNYII